MISDWPRYSSASVFRCHFRRGSVFIPRLFRGSRTTPVASMECTRERCSVQLSKYSPARTEHTGPT